MARILVIEDQADFRDTLAAMLQSADHDVQGAGNGREALDKLATGTFDLLVTDILMPEVDGIELLMAIRKMPSRLPVVAISGGGTISASLALSLSTSLGASAVLLKPFYTRELLEAVDRALGPRPRLADGPPAATSSAGMS
jgi:CheY-like chemotaxis protein